MRRGGSALVVIFVLLLTFPVLAEFRAAVGTRYGRLVQAGTSEANERSDRAKRVTMKGPLVDVRSGVEAA